MVRACISAGSVFHIVGAKVRKLLYPKLASTKSFGHRNVHCLFCPARHKIFLKCYIGSCSLCLSVSMSLSIFDYLPYQSRKVEPLWINNNFGRGRSIHIFENWWQFRQSTFVVLPEKILHLTITETLQIFITEYFYNFTFINAMQSL